MPLSGVEWVRVPSRFDKLKAPSAPIAPRDHDKIAALVRAIGPEVRGKDWSAEGVIDGLWLNVCFSRTGERGLDDIELNNAWFIERLAKNSSVLQAPWRARLRPSRKQDRGRGPTGASTSMPCARINEFG